MAWFAFVFACACCTLIRWMSAMRPPCVRAYHSAVQRVAVPHFAHQHPRRSDCLCGSRVALSVTDMPADRGPRQAVRNGWARLLSNAGTDRGRSFGKQPDLTIEGAEPGRFEAFHSNASRGLPVVPPNVRLPRYDRLGLGGRQALSRFAKYRWHLADHFAHRAPTP